jgi:hypothetical protein
MIKVQGALELEQRFLQDDVARLSEDLKKSRVSRVSKNIRIKPPLGGRGILGPGSSVFITIDPATIKAIVKSAAGLIAVWKASDIVSEFIKAFSSKLGEEAAEGLAVGVSRFFTRAYDAMRNAFARSEYVPIRFGMGGKIEGVNVRIENQIKPRFAANVSTRDQKRAVATLIMVVLPMLQEFLHQCRSHRLKVGWAIAKLALPPESIRGEYKSEWRQTFWHWHVRVDPIAEFAVDGKGRLLSPQLNGQIGEPTRRPQHLVQLQLSDLKKIATLYKRRGAIYPKSEAQGTQN